MRNIMVKMFVLFLIFYAFNDFIIYAQNNLKQLIITEAKINPKDNEIWIEVFNPTNENVLLNSVSVPYVLTPNILPPELRKKKGVELKSNERIILTADKKHFTDLYGSIINVIEIKPLVIIGNGGFIGINTLDGVENTKNTIRIGDKEKSITIAEKVGDMDIISSTSDGFSYSRELISSGGLSSWVKTIPTPGK